jgi:tetratricopeptide (TPR) repeat protein
LTDRVCGPHLLGMRILAFLFYLIAQPVMACQTLPDRSDIRAGLLEDLRDAQTFSTGRTAVSALWMFWQAAPDNKAQDLLDTGLRRLREADYQMALEVFNELVAYCPDYAEGYNQRAFAFFLRGEYAASLADLDRTLEIEPDHFGALSGKALIYLRQEREQLGQIYLRRALAINPWLNERALLRPLENTGDL